MTSEFAKVRKGQSHWRIEGYDSTTKFFEAVLPGNLNDDEVTTIIQRLSCKRLSEDEIIGTSLRKNRRSSLLEPIVGRGGANARHSIFIDHGVSYIASFWKPGESPATSKFA